MKLILASQSPRRRDLLRQMGLEFTVISPQLDEDAFSDPDPAALVRTLSREKALAVARAQTEDAVVIAADTVVVLDGQALGKPRDEEEARTMLSALSGRSHAVYTGVTVCRGDRVLTRTEGTEVTFRALAPAEIRRYAATGEPMDKAGAYGIQGLGALLVEGIRGDYFNVVGLPVCLLGQMLAEFGVDCLSSGE